MENTNESTCSIHAGQIIIGSCSGCGRPVCGKCIAERKRDRLLCHECSVKDIVASYDREREEDTEELHEAQVKKHERLTRRRKIVRLSMISALAAEAIILPFVAAKVRPKSHHWVIGKVSEAELKANECVENLWKIKAAVDEFIRDNKRPPTSLDELKNPYLRKTLTCPQSGQQYLYKKVEEGVYVFGCPTPREHALRQFCCDTTGSAPQAIP